MSVEDFVVSIVATKGMKFMINGLEKRRDVRTGYKGLQDMFEKLVGLGGHSRAIDRFLHSLDVLNKGSKIHTISSCDGSDCTINIKSRSTKVWKPTT